MSSLQGYLTVAEAAEIIGVDGSQVRRYCISGSLLATKVGKLWLIKQKEVKTFVRPPMGNPQFISQ